MSIADFHLKTSAICFELFFGLILLPHVILLCGAIIAFVSSSDFGREPFAEDVCIASAQQPPSWAAK